MRLSADVAVVAGLTLAGALLRLLTLGGESLWYDEAAMYHLVQGSWREVLAANAVGNSSPPVFPLLLGALTAPDSSEAALRAPAALAGILSIPAAWLLAREFVDSPWAFLAPLLTALSPVQVEYSQEVREYSLSFLAACCLLIAWARFLREATPRHAALVALSSVAAVCIQYGTALLAAGANLVFVAFAAWERAPVARWRLWLASQLPLAVAGIALYVTTMSSQLGHAAVGGGGYWYLLDRYWDGSIAGLRTLLTADRADFIHFAFPGKALFALVVIGAIAGVVDRRFRHATALLVAPTAVTIAAALAQAYPFGGIRQNMYLAPMVYVAAAVGLAAIAGWLRPRAGTATAWAVVAVTVGALAWIGASRSWRLTQGAGAEPMREVAAELVRQVDPGDVIYVYAGAQPAFRYYWRNRPEPWIAGSPHASGLDPEVARRQMMQVQSELLALVDERQPYWLVGSHLDEDDGLELVARLRERAAVNVTLGRGGSFLLRVTP